MEDNKETLMSPQEAAARSAELLSAQKQALDDAQAAAEVSALTDAGLGALEDPSEQALQEQLDAEDDVMKAKDTLDAAKEASRQFAEEHIGPLVDAAIAEATEAGVEINR